MNGSASAADELLLAFGFGERSGVEFAREKGFSVLTDRVDTVSNVYEESGFGEYPATTPEIIHVEVEVLAHIWHQVSELGGLVVSPLADELENPFISFRHPFSGFSHRRKPSSCTDIPNSKPSEWIQPTVRRFEYVTRLDYWQPISCCGVWRQTGTYVGPSRLDDTDVALRAVCRRECGPVVQAPARVGSAERGSETMQEYDNATQDGFGESSGQTCPNGHGIQSIERRGVPAGEVRAQPCGCNLTDVRARNFPSGQDERVATDGGEDLDEDQVYWIQNFRAFIRKFTDLDEDYVQADTEKETAAAYIQTPGLSTEDRVGICNDLNRIGFRLLSSARDERLAIGYGDRLEHAMTTSSVNEDGPEQACEVPDRDSHSGDVKIVEDEGGDILAMCAECRRDAVPKRIIDEDPGTAAGSRGGA